MAPHVLRAASRRRLWELHKSFHCSIIGTCLSTSELRKVLSRVGIRTDDQSDHELHGQGVSLSSQSDSAGKLLNKLLDERHHLAVKKYSRCLASRQVTSSARPRNSCTSHGVIGPVSSPMRASSPACRRTTRSICSGSEAH